MGSLTVSSITGSWGSVAPGHLQECAWLCHLPGKWCHCSCPAQQVTLRLGTPQGQMDDASGKQGKKSVGHWIVGSGIRKGKGLSTAFKRCISVAVIWAGGLWCRLLPCKADLGIHSQPRRLIPPCSPWPQPSLSTWKRQNPSKQHPRSLFVPKLLLHPWVACLAFGQVWKKENLRFPFPCPEWPLNESSCERDSRQICLLPKGGF